MNFEAVKQNFIDYINSNSDNELITSNRTLRRKLQKEGSIEDISIFSYMDIFKEFLIEEYDYDIGNKSASISLEEILNGMEIVDNQLVETGETADETQESEDDYELDGRELVKGIINDLLQDEEFIANFDTSNDNSIDMNELASYLTQISGTGDNEQEISINDLLNGEANPKTSIFDRAKREVSNLFDGAKEKVADAYNSVKDKVSNFMNSAYNAVSNFANGYGFSNGSRRAASSGNSTPKNSSIESMDLSELEKKKTQQEKTINSNQETLKDLQHDGGDLADNKKAIDEKLEEYNKNLKEADEELAQKVEEKEKEIAEKETAIADKQTEISGYETTISQLQSNISSIQSSISSLESQKSQLSTQSNELEGDAKTQAESKLTNINSEISKKQAELEKAQKELEETQEKLAKAQEELNKLQEELDKLNSSEKGQMGDLQSQVAENYPEIAKLYEQYQQDKEKYETQTKPQAIEKAQQDITNAQNELNKINSEIEKRKTQETISENTVYNTTLPENVAKALDSKLGSGFSQKLQQVCDNLKCDAKDLVGLMYSESGLNPSAVNKKSGATGLIQFMKTTAQSLGTTTAQLAKMTGIQQLEYVEKYLQNWKNNTGIPANQQLSAGDLYTMVFLPAYTNRNVLTVKGEKYYNANSSLDLNGDGKITKEDLTAQIQKRYNGYLGTI